MYGFIAQLVEHCTSIAEVTGSNPIEAHIFSGFVFPTALKVGKFTAMIILHLHLQLQYTNELFHIRFNLSNTKANLSDNPANQSAIWVFSVLAGHS